MREQSFLNRHNLYVLNELFQIHHKWFTKMLLLLWFYIDQIEFSLEQILIFYR